jgi:hypothetical protein
MKRTNLKLRATHIPVALGKHLGGLVTISDQNLPQRKEMENRALDDIVVFGNIVTSEPLLKQKLSIWRSREPAEYSVFGRSERCDFGAGQDERWPFNTANGNNARSALCPK